MAASKYERLPAVAARAGIGRTTVYRLMAANAFPLPTRVSRRGVFGSVDEVEAWRDARDAMKSASRFDA